MGYNLNDTEITVESPGKGAEFRSVIQSWRINLVERHFNNLTADDGYIPQQFREGLGLQYCHLYAPRKLRESVYGTDQTGKTIYGKPDLQRVNSIETPSTDHSPIIGWAYDGNPIYGPYGYLTPTGGVVTQMKSGYTLKLQSGRPSVSIFPEGFFIEDYSYSKVEDDTILVPLKYICISILSPDPEFWQKICANLLIREVVLEVISAFIVFVIPPSDIEKYKELLCIYISYGY